MNLYSEIPIRRSYGTNTDIPKDDGTSDYYKRKLDKFRQQTGIDSRPSNLQDYFLQSKRDTAKLNPLMRGGEI
jgi:hypothetical protein